MPPPKTPTPSAPAYADDTSEASDGDLTPPPLPRALAPSTPSITSKSPSVFKTQQVKSSAAPSADVFKKEPLVKPTTKKKVDSTRGAYAPVPIPSAPPSSSSEFSDFSDPERQYPTTSQRRQRTVGGAGRGGNPGGGESESEEEQEEEKEGRPPQTQQEKRKRLMWVLVAGGISIVVIIHSRESSSTSPSSHSPNSTSEADHSSNSTSSGSLNSTAAASLSGSSLTQNMTDPSKSLLDDALETGTASPTNGSANETPTTDPLEHDTLAMSASLSSNDPGLVNSALSSGGTTIAYGTQSSPVMTSDAAQQTDLASSLHSYGNLDQGESGATDFDWHHTALNSESTPSPTPPASQGPPAQPTGSDTQQSIDQGIVFDPIRSEDGQQGSSDLLQAIPTESQADIGGSASPLTEPTPVDEPSPATTIPTEWLRPVPLPTSNAADTEPSGVLQLPNDAQPNPTGSAWWPSTTGSSSSDVEGDADGTGNSTKWVGKATWFNPPDAPNDCLTEYNDSNFTIAISTEIYGADTSVSIFCGAKVHIWNAFTNQTREGTIVGASADCKGPTDLVLSKSLFSELDHPDIGTLDVQWWFDDPEEEKQTTADLSEYESTVQHQKPGVWHTT
ncbi:hypothetical protein JCM16303_004616, partial [Sporobolomyces ruberrimus]